MILQPGKLDLWGENPWLAKCCQNLEDNGPIDKEVFERGHRRDIRSLFSVEVEHSPRKGVASPHGTTKDYCLCLLRSFMEAGKEDKGMKRETFDASKIGWSLTEASAGQPLSGDQFTSSL